MRNYNPQKNQDEINEMILSKFYKEGIFNIKSFEYEGSHNSWVSDFLMNFEHQDTYFKNDSVRIQGWLTPNNSYIPACKLEFCNNNKVFIQDITLKMP